ncbi:MAG: transporter [Chromatiales bacterium]|nr:MAG: transporter [Chromatiales bacterium]
MEIDVLELLKDSPLLLIFSVLGIGYLVGNIRIFGNALGPTVGVLVIGLVFGNWGLTIAPMVGTFGFALFIFSVGLQAGPSFMSAFREDGPRYLMLAFVVAGTGVGLILLFSQLTELAPGYDAGLFAGALTSTPSLAGARDAFRAGMGNLGDLTAAQAMQNVSIGYAITYLGGTLGTIAFVRYIPKLTGIELAKDAAELERERGLTVKRTRGKQAGGTPVIRAYQIDKVDEGKTLGQRRAELQLAVVPLKIKRGNEFLEATPDLELKPGDVISVFASVEVHRDIQERLGAEVLESALLDYEVGTWDIIVLNKNAVGSALSAQENIVKHGCFVTGVMRSGIELPVRDGLVLNRGDRLSVTGERSRVEEVAKLLGHIDEEIEETDLVAFSFGIAAGVLIGLLTIKIAGMSIGLGMAGGLLITGIMIGSASSLNPSFGRVPRAARYLLRELGLMLFMAQVGLSAGGGILDALSSVGFTIVLMGLAITLGPAIVAYLFGKHLLKMNTALLLGSVTGAMTSTPALNVLNDAARSPVPSLGYAGTYTIANVLLTFAGTLIAAL